MPAQITAAAITTTRPAVTTGLPRSEPATTSTTYAISTIAPARVATVRARLPLIRRLPRVVSSAPSVRGPSCREIGDRRHRPVDFSWSRSSVWQERPVTARCTGRWDHDEWDANVAGGPRAGGVAALARRAGACLGLV